MTYQTFTNKVGFGSKGYSLITNSEQRHSALISGISIDYSHILEKLKKITNSSIEHIFRFRTSIFGIACDLSPALIGVGYIVGLNVGILVLMGGIISWVIAIPIYTSINPINGNIEDIAWNIWNSKIRFLGVGAMLVGGIWSIIKLLKSSN